jgi:hypothetical protein
MIFDNSGMVAWHSRAARVAALPLCGKQQGEVVRKRMLQAYVSIIFRCFKGTLQVFRMDVVKVDRDVAYVAMAIHACCKSIFQMFHLFLRYMLQAFYLDVAYVSAYVTSVFILMLHMLATTFKCF